MEPSLEWLTAFNFLLFLLFLRDIMKHLILLFAFIFATLTSASAQSRFTQDHEPERIEKYKQTFKLDYSMPDYTTSKIDAKVMGPRLANILDKISQMCKLESNLNHLARVQARQIDGLSYCKIKKLQLKDVTKHGNEITVVLNTTLDSNAKNIKNTLLTFRFVNGVSDDNATNDYFSGICRYIKE